MSSGLNRAKERGGVWMFVLAGALAGLAVVSAVVTGCHSADSQTQASREPSVVKEAPAPMAAPREGLQQGLGGGGQSPFGVDAQARGAASERSPGVTQNWAGIVQQSDNDSEAELPNRGGSAAGGVLLRKLPSSPSPPGSGAGQRGELATPPVPVASEELDWTLAPGQELLVIERRALRVEGRSEQDDVPGSGAMLCTTDDPSRRAGAPVVLKHTEVSASIMGPISSVRVTQQFENPYASKIEAVYVFPLPDDAAVSDFVMTIGARSIRGVIRERQQAEKIYAQARAQGHRASLMTQERSNIFTQRVANIEAGERVDVSITYFGSLGYRDGSYEFVFPMVVGPRFNSSSTLSGPGLGTGIGAVGEGSNVHTGQEVNVTYRRPEQRPGTDIAIRVEIDAGVSIEQVQCDSHQTRVQAAPGDRKAMVELSAADSIPNRDFVLRYRVAGGQIKPGLMTHIDPATGKGYFAMVVVPPEDLRYTTRGPVELVLVIDKSGSMSGEPLELAKQTAIAMIGQLRAEDRVQVIAYHNQAEFFTRESVDASPANMQAAAQYVSSLTTGGGTVLLNGLEPALSARGDWSRSRFVCVITDGFLGNEPEVLQQLGKRLGDSKVFSVGVGSSPNRGLLNAMARLGRGVSGYVANGGESRRVGEMFMERVTHAALADVRVEFAGGASVTEVYPSGPIDLYVGRPLVYFGRFSGGSLTGAEIKGRAGTERMTMRVESDGMGAASGQDALRLMWARRKITSLDERAGWFDSRVGMGSRQGPNSGEIREIALKHGLLSAYTSFVAVDSTERTSGSYGTSVAAPVNIPAGTRYDTTVE